MSGRHFLADRNELSGGLFFFFFLNTILMHLRRKGCLLGEVGRGKDRAWADHSGWALGWGGAESAPCSPGHL